MHAGLFCHSWWSGNYGDFVAKINMGAARGGSGALCLEKCTMHSAQCTMGLRMESMETWNHLVHLTHLTRFYQTTRTTWIQQE